jgi:hypothetical protein
MGETNLQTLYGPADMARCGAGARRDPCYAAQLTIPKGMHYRMHFTPPCSELEVQLAISIG